MVLEYNPSEIDVVIFCGGKGTRLRDVVSDRPKPMAQVNHRAFLDLLIDYVMSYGHRRFVLCIGHQKDYIKQYYQGHDKPIEIIFAEEESLLGTGGVLKNAESVVKSYPFIIMNGDSFCPVNLHQFVESHKAKQADYSLALVEQQDAKDYGSVKLGPSGEILEFQEKIIRVNGILNAGIYLFNQSIFSTLPLETVCSLEHDIFPKLIQERFYGYVVQADLIDIGTPERYEQALRLFEGDQRGIWVHS